MRFSLAAAILAALGGVLLADSGAMAVQGTQQQAQLTRAQFRQMLLAQFDSDGDGQLNVAECAAIRQAIAEMQQMAANGMLGPAAQQQLVAGGQAVAGQQAAGAGCMQGQGAPGQAGLQQQGQQQGQGGRQMRRPGQGGPGAVAQGGAGQGGRRQGGRGPGGQRGPR